MGSVALNLVLRKPNKATTSRKREKKKGRRGKKGREGYKGRKEGGRKEEGRKEPVVQLPGNTSSQ